MVVNARVHDGVEGQEPAGAEGGHDAAVALLVGHVAGAVGELAHDVDHRPHLPAGLVEDLDAGAGDRLLRPLVGADAPGRLAERGGRARGVDVPVPQEPHRDEHVVEALVEHRARRRGLGSPASKSRVWKLVSCVMRSSRSVTPAAWSAASP
jgi:hypothetical protein